MYTDLRDLQARAIYKGFHYHNATFLYYVHVYGLVRFCFLVSFQPASVWTGAMWPLYFIQKFRFFFLLFPYWTVICVGSFSHVSTHLFRQFDIFRIPLLSLIWYMVAVFIVNIYTRRIEILIFLSSFLHTVLILFSFRRFFSVYVLLVMFKICRWRAPPLFC